MSVTNIAWTDITWNPVTGCSPVSAGCKHCYAKVMHNRLQAMGSKKYQEDFDQVIYHPEALAEPFKIKTPKRIFVNSMSDLFHEKILKMQFDFGSRYSPLLDIFSTMAYNPMLTFQLLTKRPENAVKYFSIVEDNIYKYFPPPDVMKHLAKAGWDFPKTWKHPLPNVWFGITLENQKVWHRLEIFKKIPAAVKFLSCEPLLSDLPELDLEGIDWVIVGAESGKNARTMEIKWAESILEQCRKAGTAFFMKQMFGEKRKLKFEEFPEELQIREFPNKQQTDGE